MNNVPVVDIVMGSKQELLIKVAHKGDLIFDTTLLSNIWVGFAMPPYKNYYLFDLFF